MTTNNEMPEAEYLKKISDISERYNKLPPSVMDEMPDAILANSFGWHDFDGWERTNMPPTEYNGEKLTKYIRADLHTALAQENERLREALEEFYQWTISSCPKTSEIREKARQALSGEGD